MKHLIRIIYVLVGVFLFACKGDPEIDDSYLDGDLIFDPSLYAPEEYLVSAKYPNPTPNDLDKHIILAIHGYTASTFEWQEFVDWSTDTNYRISQVLLGGHGSTYDEFKSSSWQDWQESIMREYMTLVNLGYRKISLVGSSTGGTLLVNLVNSGFFHNTLAPKNIFMVDPIVVSSNKLQSVAGIIGPMVVYLETDQIEERDQYWYRFKPVETIYELNEIMGIVRKDLEDGIRLPRGTYCKVFHAKHDPVSSTTSTVLIYKGLSTSSGGRIDAEIIDSELHVFTRLSLREDGDFDQQDRINQFYVFQQIASRLD